MTSMLCELHEHVIVACHNRQAPAMAEWDAYLNLGLTSGVAPDRLCMLVFTQGGGPDAMQRRRMQMAMRLHGMAVAPCAIVTDAWAVRQIISVISLFNPAIRAFPGYDAKGAMAYLGIAPSLQPRLIEAAHRMQMRLSDLSQTS